MNGLLIINKQQGVTSHDVVNDIRHIFKTKQVGHLGTLDPLATGVLVICIGDATKLVQFLENVNKEYECEVTLGIETNSYDITGEVVKTENITNLNEKEIDDALNSFLGKSMQLPPIYSAIKKNGKKLYEYARKNQDVEISPREIEVSTIKRTSVVVYSDNKAKFSFKVTVSKGTYIRSLCHDLGVKLNVPATMSGLKRTRNGEFDLQNSFTIDEVRAGQFNLISMLDALRDYDMVENDEIFKKAMNGMKISLLMIKEVLGNLPPKIVICHKGELVAIYLRDDELHCYKAGRVWK